jgi:hypothetical protein
LQFQLLDLTEHLFTLPTEEHALELLNQQHQAFDLGRTRAQSRRVALVLRDQQRLGGFQIKAVEVGERRGEHERSMA